MDGKPIRRGPPTWSKPSRPIAWNKGNKDVVPEPQRKIAPGLVKLKPKRTEDIDVDRESFQTMRAPNYSNDNEPLGVWNNFGVALPGDKVEDIQDLFYSNDELLNRHNQPKTRFEANNRAALGLGTNSRTIVNMIGGKEVGTTVLQSEDRLQHLNDSGAYKDGMDRGQIKKRLRDEFERSVAMREEEMVHVSTVLREWESLPEEEKERRREKAHFNMAEMLKAVELVELDEVPKDYTERIQDPFDVVQIGDDGEASQSMEQSMEQTTEQSIEKITDRSLDKTIDQSATDPSREGALELLRAQVVIPAPVFKKPRISAVRPGKGRQKDWSSAQSTPLYGTANTTPISRSIPSSGSATPIGSGRDNRRLGTAWAKIKKKPKIPPPPPSQAWTEFTHSSFFEVENKEPEITLFEDVPAVPPVTGQSAAKYKKVIEDSTMHGRLVVVKLHPEVVFTTEAVASRIQGGHVQEMQSVYSHAIYNYIKPSSKSCRFFPDDHQAVVAFVFPWEAEAFIKHMQKTLEKSDHEFRRLQINAEWYKGLEIDSVYPSQRHMVARVLLEGASRAIQVDGISKHITHQVLLDEFKLRFPDIVRLSRVVPKKRYEQEKEDSNKMILEFNSKWRCRQISL